MSLQTLLDMNGAACPCGKSHTFQARIISGSGVLSQLPEIVAEFSAKKVYLLSDTNTYKAAGHRVRQLLEDSGTAVCSYSFPQEKVEPNEASVGSAVMHMAYDCGLIIGVGSGVINDIGKILSAISGLAYIIVATAPSMDGYASATSSMTRDGLKISLPSRGADVIIGDTDILRQAPEKMLRAGLGDMVAKYVSICEWRIAALVCGEYYCPQIAQLVRDALQLCVSQADKLLARDADAVQAVFDGLIITGVAMNYAGLSRPASGVEHYISHVVDMRAAQFGTPDEMLPVIFKATKDIRDKYVLSRLCWDLGILDEITK